MMTSRDQSFAVTTVQSYSLLDPKYLFSSDEIHEVGRGREQGSSYCKLSLWSFCLWTVKCSVNAFSTQGLHGFLKHMDEFHFFTVRTCEGWALAEESSLSCLITESQFWAGEITSSETLRLKRYFISLCTEIANECQLVPGGIFCCNRNSFSDRNGNDSRRTLPGLGSLGLRYIILPEYSVIL